MEGMGTSCSGTPLPKGGGTWKGHVIPGIVFLGWGMYWAINSFMRHLHSQSLGKNYTSRPWYPCLAAGRWLYAFEPFLKIIAAPIGVSIELYFDSPNGFRPLYCYETGRFAPEYAHNYQHASSYPAFTLSGLVDLLGLFVKLPEGTEQVFLSLALGIEGFLMVLHKKHVPLDMITHQLLGYTMLAACWGVIMELRTPSNFFVSVFRSMAVAMQGIWLIAMGQMMFTESKSWNDEYSGPAMMAPPMYAMLLIACAVGYLIMFGLCSWWHSWTLQYMSLPQASKDVNFRPQSHDSAQFSDFTIDDSANETSDDGSDVPGHVPKQKTTRQQLKAALSLLNPSQSLGRTPSKSNEHII